MGPASGGQHIGRPTDPAPVESVFRLAGLQEPESGAFTQLEDTILRKIRIKASEFIAPLFVQVIPRLRHGEDQAAVRIQEIVHVL